MQSHQIKFPRTAHYYTLGADAAHCKHLLLVMHGYGQLASRMIHKFNQLDEGYWVVAPEGFSRFYWNEKKGIVGASWMTKMNRLEEIEDYTNYLQHLLELFQAQIPQDTPITVLGFSQGGATVVRWLHRLQPNIQHIVLWGASFPQDLDYRPQLDYWNSKNIHLVQGRQDEYITPERQEQQAAFMQEQQLDANLHWYEGGHAIDRTVLKELLDGL
jgi:predicted esterase